MVLLAALLTLGCSGSLDDVRESDRDASAVPVPIPVDRTPTDEDQQHDKICSPNQVRCIGDRYERCDGYGEGFALLDVCLSPDHCDIELGGCCEPKCTKGVASPDGCGGKCPAQ